VTRIADTIRNNFALHFAILCGVVILLCATRVPFDNEYIYLLRLITTYDPSFLMNDASFAAPASEHWLFNHLFGVLTFAFSIEAIGWIGRIACWTITLFGLIRLARHWDIPLWMITVSIVIWLCQGQAVVGQEWMFGGFEAKCVAYACLIFALDGFLRGSRVYPAILLGLTFSFHPAVGLWAIVAVGLAMLYSRWKLRRILTVVGVTIAFMLPGLIPLLIEPRGISTVNDWKFLELVRMPQLFDPFSWSRALTLLVYLQLAFCLTVLRSSDDKKRFVSGLIAALGLFFTLGFVLRGLWQYQLLQYMPMRLFPIFVSLFFFLSLGTAYKEGSLGPPFKWVTGLGLACLLLIPNPLATANAAIRLNYGTWAATPADAAICFDWIRNNTLNGTVVIAPPWRKDYWYRARRAQVVSAGFPIYLDLSDWHGRVEALTGESLTNRTDADTDRRPEFYRSLTSRQIDGFARDYKADYIVTEANYPYEIVFQSGDTKVYQIRHLGGEK
jgi:hypothetical protein